MEPDSWNAAVAEYLKTITEMDVEALEREIDVRRREIAEHDEAYAKQRGADLEVTTDRSQLARTKLNMVEHELALRSRSSYGSCPAEWNWDEETPA